MNNNTINQQRQDFLSTAGSYVKQGLKPIAICPHNHDCTAPGKQPHRNQWQRPPVTDNHYKWFVRDMSRFSLDVNTPHPNIGFLCGESSGVDVLDIDSKEAVTYYSQNFLEGNPPVTQTGGGGIHGYHLSDGSLDSSTVYIDGHKFEIKASGLVIAPPSIHHTGNPYKWIREFDREKLEPFPAKFVDAVKAQLTKKANSKSSDLQGVRKDANHPHELYNNSDDFLELLQEIGWTLTGQQGDNLLLCRPGKSGAVSATFHKGYRVFYVFTTSDENFKENKAYFPFRILSLLQFEGDDLQTAKHLRRVYNMPLEYPEDGQHEEKANTKEPDEETQSGPSHGSYEIKYTDGWRAKRLVALHGDDMKWSQERQMWYVWDGTRFNEDILKESVNRAQTVTDDLLFSAHQLADAGDEKGGDYLFKQATKMDSHHKYNSCLSLAQPRCAVRLDWFDTDPMLFNVINGTVDLRTGELLEHCRSNLITKFADVEYDETATCPKWNAFLMRIMAKNLNLIDFLRRAVGYSLTASIREQVLIILHGTGANGKTSFIEAVTQMMGDYARHSPDDLLIQKQMEKHPAGLASLIGSRLAISPEINEGEELDESLVKRITGGDKITTRFMRQDFFEFNPTFKVWVSANSLPEISGQDHGIWRRIRTVPFSVQIPDKEQIPLETLLSNFADERPGILRWAIEGCLEWQENGLGIPDEVRKATDDYRSTSDLLQQFLDDCVSVAPSKEVKATALYYRYKAWCTSGGEVAENQTKFGIGLTKKGYDRARRNTGMIYFGISLV